ncbi:Snoal-like polyketide cyclase family protein [Favolaschia claudopus]|uniref:Snoal-like polyketide cyclase family protein n=1 Tax=Favolaschia claudopus TaxID=2862362 RepID=A0AAW0CND4_9AGAR
MRAFSCLFLSTLALTQSAFGQTFQKSVACQVHPASPQGQKQIFDKYIQALYVERNAPKAFDNIVAADLIQHNPAIADGFEAGLESLSGLLSNADLKITVFRITFEAPYGWLHGRLDGFLPNASALVDVFRFNGTCVQEHWDVIQERPATSQNPHPLF